MSGVVARPRFVRALGAQRRANVMRVAARREGAASSSSSSVVDVERAGVNFGTTSRLTAGLGTALASAAILAAVAACEPALADTGLETGLEEAFPKFEVTFLGQKFNHRNLVELLVLGQTIGFVGASVTGNALRKQKREVEALNEKLTRVSKELRKQTRAQRKKLRTSDPHDDNGSSQRKEELLGLLKRGKQALRESHGTVARECFSGAMGLLEDVGDELESPWRAKRKALRGLGAASAALGDHRQALEYMYQVVQISEKNADMTGLGDAYGVIADLLTEMGDYQEAGQYYDRYIDTMNKS